MSFSRTKYPSWTDVFKTYVFKKYSRRFQNVFKSFSKRPAKISSRHLQDVSQKCLQKDFKTYQQVKLLLLTRLRDIFNTFLRYTIMTAKKCIVCLQNLQGRKNFFKFQFFILLHLLVVAYRDNLEPCQTSIMQV